MNSLVNKEFFQYVLNKFIVLDVDLLSWKLTCSSCYYYVHDVYLTKFDINNNSITRYLTPVYINTDKYIYNRPTICNCGFELEYINMFDFDAFDNLEKVEELYLNHAIISNYQLEKMKSLKILDLGTSINITNKSIKKLTNLETLYLGNNIYVTKEILKYLPNLKTIQIVSRLHNEDISIKLDDIPINVSNVVSSCYMEIDYPHDALCQDFYMQLYSKIVRGKG